MHIELRNVPYYLVGLIITKAYPYYADRLHHPVYSNLIHIYWNYCMYDILQFFPKPVKAVGPV